MSSSEKKMITLRSSDGEMFEVEEAVAMESQTIKHMVEDECAKNAIPLPNVSSNNLAKVIEYCKKRVEEGGESGSLKAWADAELMNTDTLYHLMLAANYLNIKSLLDLTCQTAADMMKRKTPQQIREHFKIKNDFSPEEEAKIREENAWAFE